jgi:FMN phosphatase YigB (HAD superfamily)
LLAQAVFFDVGGTLVFGNFGHIDLLHQALRAIGFKVKRDAVTEANDLARQAVARRRRRLAARMNTVTASRMWLEHLAEALGVDLGEMDLGAALAGAIRTIETGSPARLDPDAPVLLANLRQRGYKLGVISNWPADLPEYLEGHGLAKYFDVIVASEAVGSAKPHREIFLRALAAIGCESRLAVHVGDDYWADVVGARELGIAPVLIDRLGEDVHSDCLTITRLAELSHLLDPHAL